MLLTTIPEVAVANPFTNTSNRLISGALGIQADKLEKEFDADLLAFLGPIDHGVDDVIRVAVEPIAKRRKRLLVLLETPGGYIEIVQRIVSTIRSHYPLVEFLVPNSAMSAGTVWALSGDAIHMDYYSCLGPIDPQIRRNGNFVPALGYLVQYERLIAKSKRGKLSEAELGFLIEKFDPAELYRYEQARNLSVTLLREWLAKYKFKDWKKTRTRKRKVTPRMRSRRAEEIAHMLNDTKRWHSHGRGISMDVLINDLNLQIEDFGKQPSKKKAIDDFYDLFIDFSRKQGIDGVVYTRTNYLPFSRKE